jgi:phage repressor protein C with HTH and peptisase S24 domain
MGKSAIGFTNRIKEVRKAKGLTQEQLAEAVGLDVSYISRMESGKRRVSLENLAPIATALKVSVKDLVPDEPVLSNEEHVMMDALLRQPPPSGLRESSSVNMSEAEHLPQLPNFGGPRDIPEYGAAAGGSRGKADFRFNGQVVDMAPRPPGIANKKDVYCVRVVGDSMEPKYEEGERLYLDPHRRPAIMDYVVIELKSQEEGEPGDAFIKRFVRKTPTKYIVQQFNPLKELEFDIDEVKNMHRVIPQDELLGI